MNNVNQIASLVLSGAGESLYEIDVQQPGPQQTANDPVANVQTPRTTASKVGRRVAGFGLCYMASTAAQGATPVPYSVGFAATSGAIPAGLSFLVWAPLMVLILGCVVGLMVLSRQPRQKTGNEHPVGISDRTAHVASRYDMQRAA